jgi:hypothetical protein
MAFSNKHAKAFEAADAHTLVTLPACPHQKVQWKKESLITLWACCFAFEGGVLTAVLIWPSIPLSSVQNLRPLFDEMSNCNQGVLEQSHPFDHMLENCNMGSYLLQHRADELLKIPLRTRISAPSFCPRASASATAAISMASARLLHSFATYNNDEIGFKKRTIR